MITELGLKLVEALQLQKALQSQAAAPVCSRSATPPTDAASVTEESATGPCPEDAVGSFFEAARLPQRRAYSARVWCCRRGGSVAAAARGSDPKALACALRAAAVEEMIEEL